MQYKKLRNFFHRLQTVPLIKSSASFLMSAKGSVMRIYHNLFNQRPLGGGFQLFTIFFNCKIVLTIPEWGLFTWDFWKTRKFWERSQYFGWTKLDIGLHKNKGSHMWVILVPAIQVWSCGLTAPFHLYLGSTLVRGDAEVPWHWGSVLLGAGVFVLIPSAFSLCSVVYLLS